MPRISVVTPVLNGEKYLAETIRSVLAQNFDDWEYLVLDGGSTDKTLDIARQFEQYDERIQVLQVQDEGMYDALFQGFERATGEILTWINADDVLMPWALNIADKYMTEYHDEWIGGLQAKINNEGNVYLITRPRWCPSGLIRNGFYYDGFFGALQQEGMFFTRSLIERSINKISHIRTMKYAGDFVLWTEFAKYSKLKVLPTALAAFRMHGGNLSRQHVNGYLQEVRDNSRFFIPRFWGITLRRVVDPLMWLVGVNQARRRIRQMRILFEPGFDN